MSLRALRNPNPMLPVQVSDDEHFIVRGLSPSHIIGLYYRHAGELEALFTKIADQHKAGGGKIEQDAVAALALSMLNEAPMVLAEVIALAMGISPADTHDWVEEVALAYGLPFPVQADALSKIVSLTFTSDMPPGKLVSLVARAIKSATPTRDSTA